MNLDEVRGRLWLNIEEVKTHLMPKPFKITNQNHDLTYQSASVA